MVCLSSVSDDQLQHPLNITCLCDDVLIKIFSYFDLYDKNIILPKVCKRFFNICWFALPKNKEIDSNEFQMEKWTAEENITKCFQKIGPHIKKFKINYALNRGVTKKKKRHLNLMLKHVRKYCSTIDTLQIETSCTVGDLKNLPKSIRKLDIECYIGKSLDLRYLNNLETLHLEFGFYMFRMPDGFEWIKVKNRLHEMKLNLDVEAFPNFATMNQLLSSISINYSLNLTVSNMINDHDDPYINFDPLYNVSNLNEFCVYGFQTNGEEFNKLLCFLAEKTSVTYIDIGVLSCNTLSIITSQTIDSLFESTALNKIEFTCNEFIHSLITGYLNKLELKNIRMNYGYLGDNPGHTIKLSMKKLTQILAFFSRFDHFRYYPKDRDIVFGVQADEQHEWETFTTTFLHSAPKVIWEYKENHFLHIDIIAKTRVKT